LGIIAKKLKDIFSENNLNMTKEITKDN